VCGRFFMVKPSVNLQDSFLNQVRKENSEVSIILLGGNEMTGLVRGFDNFTVILNVKGQPHLIYKHAIAEIVSSKKMGRDDFHEEELPAQDKKPDTFNPINLTGIKIK